MGVSAEASPTPPHPKLQAVEESQQPSFSAGQAPAPALGIPGSLDPPATRPTSKVGCWPWVFLCVEEHAAFRCLLSFGALKQAGLMVIGAPAEPRLVTSLTSIRAPRVLSPSWLSEDRSVGVDLCQ